MKTTRARELLANAVKQLMQQRPDLDTQVKVADASKLSQATIHRILAQTSAATVDNLGHLATAFGIEISELLEDPTADRIIYDKRRYATLSEHDKVAIARYIAFVLDGALTTQNNLTPDETERHGNVRAANKPSGDQTLNITSDERFSSPSNGTSDPFPHKKIRRGS